MAGQTPDRLSNTVPLAQTLLTIFKIFAIRGGHHPTERVEKQTVIRNLTGDTQHKGTEVCIFGRRETFNDALFSWAELPFICLVIFAKRLKVLTQQDLER